MRGAAAQPRFSEGVDWWGAALSPRSRCQRCPVPVPLCTGLVPALRRSPRRSPLAWARWRPRRAACCGAPPSAGAASDHQLPHQLRHQSAVGVALVAPRDWLAGPAASLFSVVAGFCCSVCMCLSPQLLLLFIIVPSSSIPTVTPLFPFGHPSALLFAQSSADSPTIDCGPATVAPLCKGKCAGGGLGPSASVAAVFLASLGEQRTSWGQQLPPYSLSPGGPVLRLSCCAVVPQSSRGGTGPPANIGAVRGGVARGKDFRGSPDRR